MQAASAAISAFARAAARVSVRFQSDPQTKAAIDSALGAAYFGLTDYPNAENFRRSAWQLLASSRGEAEFADKLLSAMRFEFGGHVEKPV